MINESQSHQPLKEGILIQNVYRESEWGMETDSLNHNIRKRVYAIFQLDFLLICGDIISKPVWMMHIYIYRFNGEMKEGR